jgi:hypothetical protein
MNIGQRKFNIGQRNSILKEGILIVIRRNSILNNTGIKLRREISIVSRG